MNGLLQKLKSTKIKFLAFSNECDAKVNCHAFNIGLIFQRIRKSRPRGNKSFLTLLLIRENYAFDDCLHDRVQNRQNSYKSILKTSDTFTVSSS